MKMLITILTMMTTASMAFAEADFDPDRFKAPPVTTAPGTATRDGTGSVTPTPTQSTINQGSQQGQQSQSGGSGANAAVGAALMAAGAALMSNPPTVPPGAMLMAMGVLAMMQSGHDSDAAGQSGNTGIASLEGNKLTNPDAATGSSAFTAGKIAEGKAALAAQGYTMDSKGNITGPDGTVTPPSAFNSASGMAAAGMTPQAIADAQKILADAANGSGARVSGVGIASSGGSGSGGFTEGESGGEASATGGMGSNPFALDANQKNKLVAGKTVLFDGEPIGVRGQNIFEMVHTCYEKKRKGNHFIESEQDVSVRAPASYRRASGKNR